VADLDLTYAFGLKPEVAIRYFADKAKDLQDTWDWYELWQEAHARAFTVAKAMKADILQDIHAEVQRGLTEGITFAEFKQSLTPKLKARGWWGEIVNEQTGELAVVGPHRLRTIFDTNVQTAYQAGHYQHAMEVTASRPWWQYSAINDKRTRPAHAALSGLAFRFDDPFWDSHYPPNGFRCRCSVSFKEDVAPAAKRSTVGANADATLASVELPIYRGKDSPLVKSTSIKTTDLTGRPLAMAPDAGWSYNPGKAGWQPDLERVDHRIARQYIKDSLAGPDFTRFFAGKSAGDFPIAVLRPEDKAILGSETQTVWLSQESLLEHLDKHPEVRLADYRKVPDILDSGEVYQQNTARLIYLKVDEKLYRAVLKRTANRKDNYFLTLFETTTDRAKRQVVDKYERIR